MPYLGSTPTTQSFISGTDYFNGTGSQTAFTLTRTVASVNDIEAVVNNVVQQPNDAYNISGTTITFTSAPSAGTNNVYVRYLSTTTQAITPSQNTVSWNTLDSNVQGDLGISFKNRIINSNMAIDQRNAGATVTIPDSTGTYTLDRWRVYEETDGVITVNQDSTAPAGFTRSLKVAVTTADGSLSAAQTSFIQQSIEGFNIADFAWGSASAKPITVSFWVRSSVTGTFGGSARNDSSRSYPFSYTISSANTWEQKSITIVGDTAGSWATTNGTGLRLYFSLGDGGNLSGTAGAWTNTAATTATGATNLLATSGATFFLTGVQLEVGTQATTFTTAGGSYGAELALCQRYYWQVVRNTVTGFQDMFIGAAADQTTWIRYCIVLPVAMRATPSLVSSAASSYGNLTATGTQAGNSIGLDPSSTSNVTLNLFSGGISTGQAAVLRSNNSFTATIGFSAEL